MTNTQMANIHSVGNVIEAGVWFAMAVVLAVIGRRSISRHLCWFASTVLVAFGLSDIVESQTGAWWRPWWLLLWKAGCIAVFLLLIRKWLRCRNDASAA